MPTQALKVFRLVYETDFSSKNLSLDDCGNGLTLAANLTVILLMTLLSEPVGSIAATIGAIYVTLTDLSIKRTVYNE